MITVEMLKKHHRLGSMIQFGSENECWIWIGNSQHGGYGYISWKSKSVPAHKLIYELLRGPVPPGFVLMHRCENKPCCNPAHLRIGTDEENHLHTTGHGFPAWDWSPEEIAKLSNRELVTCPYCKGTGHILGRVIAR